MAFAHGDRERFAENVTFNLGQQSWPWRKEKKRWKRREFLYSQQVQKEPWNMGVFHKSWCMQVAYKRREWNRKERKSKRKRRKKEGKVLYLVNMELWPRTKPISPPPFEFYKMSSVAQLCLKRNGIIQPSVGVHVVRQSCSVPKRWEKKAVTQGMVKLVQQQSRRTGFCRACFWVVNPWCLSLSFFEGNWQEVLERFM